MASTETLYNGEMNTGLHENNSEVKDVSTMGRLYSWDYLVKLSEETEKKEQALLASNRATSIITPDRTPKGVISTFSDNFHLLSPILEADSPRRFLRLFQRCRYWMTWGLLITPQTLNYMVVKDAVRCAKLALEGQSPELSGYCANPNYMNEYGYFPLHQAAESFSVNMVKLLISKGALANLRMAGGEVIGDLLPLHIAVENTCLHKYLEETLFPNREHPDYSKEDVYKLIRLLCLPEMKIFLDATRELAKHTHNLVDEVWNYIKDGKLAQAGVLLLAAQKHIRSGSSGKKNGDSKPDGFGIIMNRIVDCSFTLDTWMDGHEKEQEWLQAKKKFISPTMLLVLVISQAGEALDAFIQVPSEVPHMEVFNRVSSILKVHGFYPPEKCIDIGNLRPYECLSDEELSGKNGVISVTKAATEIPDLDVAGGKAKTKKQPKIRDFRYILGCFFPFWRSVLSPLYTMKVYPHYAIEEALAIARRRIHGSGNEPVKKVSSVPSRNLHLLPPPAFNHQSRRLFGSAALTLWKVLKKA